MEDYAWVSDISVTQFGPLHAPQLEHNIAMADSWNDKLLLKNQTCLGLNWGPINWQMGHLFEIRLKQEHICLSVAQVHNIYVLSNWRIHCGDQNSTSICDLSQENID